MKTIMNENNQQQKEVEMEELQQLLKDVYEATKDIKQEKAEPFDVIGTCIGTQETIHSKFLAELLNPHGSHGLGSAFLKAFYEQIGLKYFHSERYSVRTEVNCKEKGKKKTQEKENEGQESNGRIDIIIKNSQELVVIENKIHAVDQPDQLKRYSEWLNKQGEANKKLIYLTLDGHEASNAKDIDYQRISYSNDILKWLDKCIAEIFKSSFSTKDGKTNAFAKNKIDERNAFVKKLLLQYKELIKKLTGEHMNPSMKDAVTSATTANAQNYLAAAYIAQTFNDCHQRIIQEIAEECKGDMSWSCKMEGPDSDGRIGFSYTLKEDQQYKLLFEFQWRNYTGLFYGLHTKEKEDLSFLNKWESGKRFEPPKGELDFYSTSPNNDGWIFSIKVSEDKFKNWDAESFAKRWKEQASNSKENQPSLSEVKELFKKKLTTYINILLTFIEEDKKGNNFLRIDKSAN